MLSSFQILFPVFGLVFAGFACRRRGVLGPSAASELNRFVVWLALPVLLFDIAARATWLMVFKSVTANACSVELTKSFGIPEFGYSA